MYENILLLTTFYRLLSVFSSIPIIESSKPNVLLILADDVGVGDIPGYHISSSGQGSSYESSIHMPNIQRLMSMGTIFTDFHSTPLCAPSRYVLLSGNYQDRGRDVGGTWQINEAGSQFLFGQQSLAQVLREKGHYHTAVMGKWHLGGKIPTKCDYEPSPDADVWLDQATILSNENYDWSYPIMQGPRDIGFDSSYITVGGLQAPPYKWVRNGYFENASSYRWYKARSTRKTDIGISKILGGKTGQGSYDWDSSAYDMILVNETERFLDDHLENHKNDPFFAYFALGAVHTPHTPPYKYLDGSPVAGVYPTHHMDKLGEMDKVVGSLIELLENRSLLSNTIIVFASDNGGWPSSLSVGHDSNYPLRGLKGEPWEGGHRVPLIIRWDDGMVPRGEKRSHLVGMSDIFKTICDLVGVTVPPGQAKDSISFSKYLIDDTYTYKLREYLRIPVAKPWNMKVIRKGDYKLIIKRNGAIESLYNLADDLGETNDLKDDKNYKDLIVDMRSNWEIINHQESKVKKYVTLSSSRNPFLCLEATKCNVILRNCNKSSSNQHWNIDSNGELHPRTWEDKCLKMEDDNSTTISYCVQPMKKTKFKIDNAYENTSTGNKSLLISSKYNDLSVLSIEGWKYPKEGRSVIMSELYRDGDIRKKNQKWNIMSVQEE